MTELAPYRPADRSDVEGFLRRPNGLHVYLESRLDTDAGDAFVHRRRGTVEGFAWFGRGRNLVLAGEEPEFLRALAGVAREFEKAWVMVVGPSGPVTDFIADYHRGTERRPRLDRSQGYYLQTRETLPDRREPSLRLATERDVAELAPAAARMSGEDFEIDVWRIDREAVRRNILEKVRNERVWLFRDFEDGELAFKADLAVTAPSGVQVEGVYTPERFRGRGIASRCMSELGHRLLANHPLVSLHVSSTNTPACRAYENAGYRRTAELRLAIYPG